MIWPGGDKHTPFLQSWRCNQAESGQQFGCFFFSGVCACVCAWVCMVGGPFLSLQCSLPAGRDDDRSPVLCSEPGGWQDLTELINTDTPPPGWPRPWQWLNWPQIAFDREQCQHTTHTTLEWAHKCAQAHIDIMPYASKNMHLLHSHTQWQEEG